MSASKQWDFQICILNKRTDLFLLRMVTFIYIKIKNKFTFCHIVENVCCSGEIQLNDTNDQWWNQHTAFLEACAGLSEALQCMCHIVFCIQTLRLYGQQKTKKHSSIRLKYFSIHSCLTDVCFLHRIIKEDCWVELYTSNTMWKHTYCTVETIQHIVYK